MNKTGKIKEILVFLFFIFVFIGMGLVFVLFTFNVFGIVTGIFFVITGLYLLFYFINNFVLGVRLDVVCLVKRKDGSLCFVNKKGKRYYYNSEFNLELNKYYQVYRDGEFIYSIKEEVFEDWNPVEKNNFWLTWYSPFGLFEDVFLLPIVYVAFVFGIIELIMNKKLIMVLFVSTGFIIYDIYFKLKK